jgi:hypothetical protein
MDDDETIEIPETPVAATPWLAYGVLAAAALGLLIYVTPARRVVAVLAVAGAQRTGRRVPRVVEEWASAPSSEAAAVFRRLAPWPTRLGVALDAAATPGERARALAEQVPHQAEAITTIAEAYILERYGGQAAAKGEAGRAWRRLRPHLYRASFSRLLGGLFMSQED